MGEGLYDEILRALEIDGQDVAHLNRDQTEQIALARSLGHKAGRYVGWKVRTFQTDPENRDDGKVVIIVTVVESTPEERKRIHERSELLIRNMQW